MNEALLVGCFCLLGCVALAGFIHPLQKKFHKIFLIIIPLLIVGMGAAYWHWGAGPAWLAFTQEEIKRTEAKALLAKLKSPDELAEKLRAKLDNRPESARGWYLLGRIYVSQDQWEKARDAFATAHHLNPDDEQTTINYANALWQLNHQAFNDEVKDLFNKLLEKNPKQPDALAMLAMDAYQNKAYSQAEMYWRRLLTLVPDTSDEAKALRKAIAKVQQMG